MTRKWLFLGLAMLISASSSVAFDFSITNSSGGSDFVLGDYFIMVLNESFETVNVSIITSSDEWAFSKNMPVNDGIVVFNSSVADPFGSWNVTVTHENESVFKSITTVLRGESAYYGVNFNSPVKDLSYYRGENITISAEVFRGVEKISGASVRALIDSDEVALSEISDGVYSSNYFLDLDSSDSFKIIRLVAERTTGQGIRAGGSFMRLNIVPARINVSLLNKISDSFRPGDVVEFNVSGEYSNGLLVDAGRVVLSTPPGQEFFVLSNGFSSFYYVIPESFSGAWNARLTVTDEYGNEGSLVFNILVRRESLFNNPAFIGFALILSAALALILFSRGFRFYRFALLNYYSGKQKDLKRMQSITQKKYFNRVIDEETYMELMRKYETSLVNVQTSVKELKRKLGLRGEARRSGKKK